MALENTRKIFGNKITYYNNVLEAIRNSDAIIIATEWPQYKKLEPYLFRKLMRNQLIIDGRRIYDKEYIGKLKREGIKIYAIGLTIYE